MRQLFRGQSIQRLAFHLPVELAQVQADFGEVIVVRMQVSRGHVVVQEHFAVFRVPSVHGCHVFAYVGQLLFDLVRVRDRRAKIARPVDVERIVGG